MNKITCRKITAQGLPTEYYFPKDRLTAFNPNDILKRYQEQWPMLEFELEIIE